MGESPQTLRASAPRAWAYLERHGARLARRRSSIYKGRPPFSIFGIGDYSFQPWKVERTPTPTLIVPELFAGGVTTIV